MRLACGCRSCFYATIPGDEAGCRKVFEFGRKMGIETFISEPPPESLDVIERFCDGFVRDAYLQRRLYLVHDGNPPEQLMEDPMEDFEDPEAMPEDPPVDQSPD